MDLEGILLSEISQTTKNKYVISLICGIQNTHQKTELTDAENRAVVARGEGGGWG